MRERDRERGEVVRGGEGLTICKAATAASYGSWALLTTFTTSMPSSRRAEEAERRKEGSRKAAGGQLIPVLEGKGGKGGSNFGLGS